MVSVALFSFAVETDKFLHIVLVGNAVVIFWRRVIANAIVAKNSKAAVKH